MRKYGFELTRARQGQCYIIEGTGLVVEKYESKRYGQLPEWDILHPEQRDRALVTGTSLDDVMARFGLLRDAMSAALRKDCPVKGASCTLFSDVLPGPEAD